MIDPLVERWQGRRETGGFFTAQFEPILTPQVQMGSNAVKSDPTFIKVGVKYAEKWNQIENPAKYEPMPRI